MNEDFKNLEQSDEIKLLKFPECVRQRIGMYLSGTDSTDNLLREIIDNSIDECYKIADTVIIDRYFNGLQLVADNGRGISIEYSSEGREDGSSVIQADLSISALHSGSKFSDNKDATVGMNGVGSSAVNAVSENYILLSRITPLNFNKSTKEVFDVWNNAGPRSKKDLFYMVWYKKGYKYYEGAGSKKGIEKMLFGKKPEKTLPTGMSTIVMFNPDPEIFDEKARKTEIPIQNLKYFLLIQEKFYKKKILINVEGSVLANSDFTGFGFEFTKRIIPVDTSMNPYIDLFVSFGVDEQLAPKEYYGSINSLNVDTGAHITYMEDMFVKALKDEYKIKHRYTTNGLKMCVVALAPEVTFNSQTKERLKAFTKVKESDFEPVIKEFQKIFRKNSDYWTAHVERLNYLADSMKNLGAADKAQRMIDAAAGNSVYRNKGKFINDFVDATGTDRWNCELFITEGKSPYGALKAGRKDARHHAVLALRGKVLNTTTKTADQMLENAELNSIFMAIGLGLDCNNVINNYTTPEEAYEIIKNKSRYSKICIATDADSDGSQISNLLLYAFSKYARFMIDFGLIYIALSPIYEQNGKYYYPNDPRVQGTDFPVGLQTNKPFRRFKGLGALRTSDVYDVFYNPATRRLVQVTPEGMDYFMGLMEKIDERKNLLINAGILSNPFNFSDL